MSNDSKNVAGELGQPTDLPPAMRLPANEDFADLFQELSEQSDRGVAVLGASFLDWRVREAIKSQFRVWDKPAIKLIGKDDGGSGVLDYCNKCRLAHALGIVGDVGLSDLHIIGEIRNKFAHRTGFKSFTHPTILKLCNKLDTINHNAFTKDFPRRDMIRIDPRNHFFVVVVQLSQMVAKSAQDLAEGKHHTKLETHW